MIFSRLTLTIVAVVMAISPLTAHNVVVNVAQAINTDSTATITVVQPIALDRLLRCNETSSVDIDEAPAIVEHNDAGSTIVPTFTAGYRVQVFSDNNQRTAKGEARAKEQQINQIFPEYGTYVVYNSPYWRLKVGDFRTKDEAEAVADEIKSRFPSFSREVRVVHDRVNVRQ